MLQVSSVCVFRAALQDILNGYDNAEDEVELLPF